MEDFTLFDYLFSLEVDSVDYKNPAQVLKTLVREKKTKYRESSFLDLLNGKEGSWEDIYRVTKKLLTECSVSEDGVDMTPVTKFIDSSILDRVTFRKATYHEEEIACCTTKSRNAVTVVIGERAKVGVLDKKLRKSWDCGTLRKLCTYSDWVGQIDLIRFCSELIVYSEMLRYYRDKLEGRSVSELKENVVFAKSIPLRVSLREEELEIIEWCKQFGIEVDVAKYGYHPDIYTYLSGVPIDVKFMNYVTLNVFKDIVEEYNLEKRREKYLREVNGDYALSFMDLKNKPDKFIEAANNSAFKKYFGAVEYDPDCDLKKLSEIEKEFLAIIPMFKVVDFKLAVIRFRKLGNHKAIGLYYPMVKCLCVDIRAPRSFVHELFHLIDWESDELSLKYDFFDIRKEYEKELRKTLSSMDDNSLKKKLSGSSKYSIDYYLEPSEIFARCGEVYAYKKMGIRNSLAKIDNFTEFGYDLSDELYAKVESYFDIILGGEGYGNIHDKVAAGV